MNNLNTKLHHYQRALITELSLHPHRRFNQLLIEGLESEHMNYHLRVLIELEFVTKQGHHYLLTDAGKDYSNLLDEKTELIEKQPKTSIIIRGVRKNPQGEIEHLLNRRLRQPYYGKVGRITGKVRFGETFQQAAARELYEETGLTAKNFQLEQIYRKMRYKQSTTQSHPDKKVTYVQDAIFYIFHVTDFTGKLITQTPYQQNFWITRDQCFNDPKYDPYDDLDLDDSLTPKPFTISEPQAPADGY